MSNEKITKTIIKGLKKVTRYELRYKYDGEPELMELEFNVESDEIIDELEYDLIISDDNACWAIINLQLLIYDKLKDYRVRKVDYKDNVKVIVVNEILEEEHQDYLEDVIKNEYAKKYDEYFKNFIEKYKNDKGKMALINMYSQTMTPEEIVGLLKSENAVTQGDSYDATEFANIIFKKLCH